MNNTLDTFGRLTDSIWRAKMITDYDDGYHEWQHDEIRAWHVAMSDGDNDRTRQLPYQRITTEVFTTADKVKATVQTTQVMNPDALCTMCEWRPKMTTREVCNQCWAEMHD